MNPNENHAGVNLQSLISSILPELVSLRHDLHQHPELAFQEHQTAKRILHQLERIEGLQIQTGLAGTGIVAMLNADRAGPCVALRADMDALPIEEANTFDYRSRSPGRMHACGHDGHMTCLVGAARVLAEYREVLPGKVKFLFQPAEEHGGGGRKMVELGVLRDPPVSAAFALHGWPELPLGHAAVGVGPVLAAATSFRIELTGRGTHAAYPHRGTDVILAAASLVTRLQAIVSRTRDPLDPVVISICSMHGGETYNVLPSSCTLLGTLRALRQDVHDSMAARIVQIASTVWQEFGIQATVEFVDTYPSLVNHPGPVAIALRAAKDALGDGNVSDHPLPSMGGEDFAFYAREVPSAFWCLGIRPPSRTEYPMLHQPTFDFPDDALPLGVEIHCRVAMRALMELGAGEPGRA